MVFVEKIKCFFFIFKFIFYDICNFGWSEYIGERVIYFFDYLFFICEFVVVNKFGYFFLFKFNKGVI